MHEEVPENYVWMVDDMYEDSGEICDWSDSCVHGGVGFDF